MRTRILARSTILQAAVVALLSLVSLVFGTAARANVVVTPVGSPLFAPADFHLFAAPIGTATSGYAEFFATQQQILPPPHHVPNPTLGIGPGAPHAGPYDAELAEGVAAGGFFEGTSFTTKQYSNGSGVYFVFMLIPGAGGSIGSSPDSASGAILSNALFPLTISGRTYTDGTFNNSLGDFQVPAINEVPGFEAFDGHSHIPFFFADSFDFASNPVTGSYEYRISILDELGNGYQVAASFDVLAVPEPSTWLLACMGGLAVFSLARRRPRVQHAKGMAS